nr:hypothetical protein [Ardenticatenia bacterium]
MHKALVTGGAGFIGSHLVDGLGAPGEFDPIGGYGNLPSGGGGNNRPHVSRGAARVGEGGGRGGGSLKATMGGGV